MALIGVVIVTYNRLDKLKIALNCFESQTFLPAYIIVVDNHSTDETHRYLKDWELKDSAFKKIVISMNSNTGGSGGFYEGLNKALSESADWVWVSDDDAFPEKDALEVASDNIGKLVFNGESLSAICGTVINNGSIDYVHRRRIIKKVLSLKTIKSDISDYAKESFEINCFSYVGTIINKQKMQQVGITNKDFFIWWDDTEHSLRLSKVGKILCFPSIKVHHDVVADSCTYSWKLYYGLRNELYTIKNNFPRRYYLALVLRRYLGLMRRVIFSPKDKKIIALYKAALKDGRKEKLGTHSLYKPGWK